ncbi:MAG: 3'(2'),5'-bisphosphate nucleotidase CysQ [Pseudomonadota bacterium]
MPDADNHTVNLADLALMEELAREAGAIAMGYFGDDPQVWMKEGQSPVSEADFAVDTFLKEKLLAARPDYGWLSEETADDHSRHEARRVFVVDPIDGTRGFINGMKRWCVSVAVVEDNRPVAGVLECPVLQETFCAALSHGTTVNGERLHTEEASENGALRLAGPRPLAKRDDLADMEIVPFVPSLAYRIAMVANNALDGALARGSAKDWDLAAADIIAHEAGACLTDMDGERLAYNCKDIRHGTLVAASPAQHEKLLDIARRTMNKPGT